jgi:hypothetical protein
MPSSKKQVQCALHDLYSSLNIIKVIKSRKTRWMGHMHGEIRKHITILAMMHERKETIWEIQA